MSTSPFDLSGRVALVTGSSRGIGLALARALGEAGAELIVNGRDESALRAAAETLRDEGLTVHGRPFDVCDPAAVVDAVDSVERDVGPIEVLVNRVGRHARPAADPLDSSTSPRTERSLTRRTGGSGCSQKHSHSRRSVRRRAPRCARGGSGRSELSRPHGVLPIECQLAAVGPTE